MVKTDNPWNEIFIGVIITFLSIFLEWILNELLGWRYVGIVFAVITYIVYVAFRYVEMKNSFNILRDEVTKLKEHHELLTAPKGYLEYLFDVFNKIKNPNGYPFHTHQYTEILAKFLTAAKQSFVATWTINVDLEHMSETYREQQRRFLKSKRRFLFLSKNILQSLIINNKQKIVEFINWHKENGIKLLWIDRQKCINSIIQSGSTSDDIATILPQCEDFILVDDDVVLFYDTKDEIKEGARPEQETFYSVSLISMASLRTSSDPSFQNIGKIISNVCSGTNAKRIKDIGDLETALDC